MVSWTNWPHTRVAAFVPLLLWSLERLVQLRTAKAARPDRADDGGDAARRLPGRRRLRALPRRALLPDAAARHPRQAASAPTSAPRLLAGVGLAHRRDARGLPAAALLLAAVRPRPRRARSSRRCSTCRCCRWSPRPCPKAFGTCPGRDYVGPINQVEVNAYVGSAVLVLALLALLRRRARDRPPARGPSSSSLPWSASSWAGSAARCSPPRSTCRSSPTTRSPGSGSSSACASRCSRRWATTPCCGRARRSRSRWTSRSGSPLGAASLLVVMRLRDNLRPTGHLAHSDRQTLYAALAVAVVLAAIALAAHPLAPRRRCRRTRCCPCPGPQRGAALLAADPAARLLPEDAGAHLPRRAPRSRALPGHGLRDAARHQRLLRPAQPRRPCVHRDHLAAS